MKSKYHIVYTIIFIILFIVLYMIGKYFLEQTVTVKLNNIEIRSEKIYYQQMQYYGVTEDEVDGKNVKKVVLECEIKNISPIRKIVGAEVIFEKNQQLPPIILGDKLNAGQPEILILSKGKNRKCAFLFLVDAGDHSNEEIISEIGGIDLCVIESKHGHKVSKTIKCKAE